MEPREATSGSDEDDDMCELEILDFCPNGTLSSLPRGGLEYISFLGGIVKNDYLVT